MLIIEYSKISEGKFSLISTLRLALKIKKYKRLLKWESNVCSRFYTKDIKYDFMMLDKYLKDPGLDQ